MANSHDDPRSSHIDLLSCRNVMIYFQQILQRRVIATFHYALEPGGYPRHVGESARVSGSVRHLRPQTEGVRQDWHRSKAAFDLPTRVPPTAPHVVRDAELLPVRNWPDLDLQQAADRIVLARFAPAGVVIDEQLNVLQVRGQTAPFVELPPGTVSWNLLRLLRPEVLSQIKDQVDHAIRDNVPVNIAPVHLHEAAGGARQVGVDILPISNVTLRSPCFLILFQPLQDAAPVLVAELLPPAELPTGAREAASLMNELGVRTTAELTRYALSKGIITS